MRLRHLVNFCWADTEFFDSPERVDDSASRYPDPTALDEASWRRVEHGIWVHVGPLGVRPPEQGWKVHVSSTVDDSAKVLDVVWRYCIDRRFVFKFVRSERLLWLTNEKGSHRGSSGKFITIYPHDEDALAAVLHDLEPALAIFKGPYILSDLRHRGGPLYVRYGGFRALWCQDDDDEIVPAVRAPDGQLVPDVRVPGFTIPDRVRLPAFLQGDLAARQRPIAEEFPYHIERAIQFSNGGGVYAATDERTGERVIVREARPHAGLDQLGNDAVHRMGRERKIRARLADLRCVPRLIDYRVVRDHHYLIEEFIDGHNLLEAVVSRHPLASPGVSTEELADYATWASGVADSVEHALAAIHERGISYGDLHPRNIMVRPDDTVAFLDFEFAAEFAEQRRQLVASPGFGTPPDLGGAQADRYALERVRLMTLVPLMALAERHPAKFGTMVDIAASELPLGEPVVARLRRAVSDAGVIEPDHACAMFDGGTAGLAAVRQALAATICASATPDRTDRLFPGHPAQFRTGGIDVETGAAGVLYALYRAGATVPDEFVDWLMTRALTMLTPRAGLFTGLHGVAVVLDDLGRRDLAQQVLDQTHDLAAPVRGVGLRGGQAGIALALVHLARRTGDTALLDRAVAIADRIEKLVTRNQSTSELRTPTQPGLLQGMTGVAVLFIRLFEELSDHRYLNIAEICLHRDLGHCKSHSPGTCYMLDGSRHMPYLDQGSLGLALVMAHYLQHREHPIFDATVAAVRRSCDAVFVFQGGLFQGRAGIILGLGAINRSDDAASIEAHVRRLGWHALTHRNGIAFPGDHNLRLSMDYSTGSAGVLLAVQAKLTGKYEFLPAYGAI